MLKKITFNSLDVSSLEVSIDDSNNNLGFYSIHLNCYSLIKNICQELYPQTFNTPLLNMSSALPYLKSLNTHTYLVNFSLNTFGYFYPLKSSKLLFVCFISTMQNGCFVIKMTDSSSCTEV